MNQRIHTFSRLAFVLAALTASRLSAVDVELTVDPTILANGGALWGQLTFNNIEVPLSPDHPANVIKIPVANGTLMYGKLTLGDGPASDMTVVLDREPLGENDQRRIYLDVNRNGDLTDDGDGVWQQLINRGMGFKASTTAFKVAASYASGTTADYGVIFIYAIPNNDRGPVLTYRRAAARVGTVQVDGQPRKAVLIENNSHALYDEAAISKDAPLWLMVDMDGDGRVNGFERFNANRPIQLGKDTVKVVSTRDGSRLTITPTTGPGQVYNKPAPRPAAGGKMERPPLLAAGAMAPDFSVDKAGGGQMKLSDLRGQIVILDFWATWCGPCKAAMPGFEALYNKVKAQGVTAFGVCVWDDREAFDKWLVEPQVKTSYPLAFDRAGKNSENRNADSIAKRDYKVSGIPTFYIIDRDGKIAASFMGNSPESKAGLEETLTKMGVKL